MPLLLCGEVGRVAADEVQCLENELRCQLHVASFEVTAREDAALRWNEARDRIAGSVSKAADVK